MKVDVSKSALLTARGYTERMFHCFIFPYRNSSLCITYHQLKALALFWVGGRGDVCLVLGSLAFSFSCFLVLISVHIPVPKGI